MPHVKGTPSAPAGPAAGVVLDLARSAADEGEARAWADDCAFLAWAEGGGGALVIAAELKVRVGRRGGRGLLGGSCKQGCRLACTGSCIAGVRTAKHENAGIGSIEKVQDDPPTIPCNHSLQGVKTQNVPCQIHIFWRILEFECPRDIAEFRSVFWSFAHEDLHDAAFMHTQHKHGPCPVRAYL